MNRRSFVRYAAVAALLPREVAAVLRAQGQEGHKRLLQLNAYALDAETPLDLLTGYITPNDLLFIRSHYVAPRIDPASWTLTIDGAVSRSMRLTLGDLQKLPRTDTTCVLQCAGNGRSLFTPHLAGVQWRHGAVGNARWTGVRVKEVLDRAGLRSGAHHLHTFGSDIPPGQVPPFHRSLEMEKVLQDAIIAYAMNGEPLSHDHGAPARLVVPGWAGDHWMKWLRQIVPSRRPQTGFYMDTAYRYPLLPGKPGQAFKTEEMRPLTALFVKSTITSAPTHAPVGMPLTIRGFAFSGAPDIVRVEITDDDGKTWTPADLDHQHDPYAWRLWSWTWTPQAAGIRQIAVRATDSRGGVQPREPAWNQSGYLHNGWHSTRIEVTA